MSPFHSRQLTSWGATLALVAITLSAAGYYIYEAPFPVVVKNTQSAVESVVIKTWEQVVAADLVNLGQIDFEAAMRLMKSDKFREDSVEGNLLNKMFFEKMKQAAEKGHIRSMFHAGKCLQRGFGCECDEELALKYFHQSAMLGYDLAAMEIAKCHANGIGVVPNRQIARQWYERAIQHRRSECLLGYGEYLWRNGQTDAEVKYGLNLLREAAIAGQAEASFMLAGAIIKTGKLTPAIRQVISAQVRAGAQQQRNWNCANLMMEMYLSGLAFPEGQDARKAYYWSLISLHLADGGEMMKYCEGMVQANGEKLSKDIRAFEQMFAQDWILKNSQAK